MDELDVHMPPAVTVGMLRDPHSGRAHRDASLYSEVAAYRETLAHKWTDAGTPTAFVSTTNRLRTSSGNDIAMQRLLPRRDTDDYVDDIVDGIDVFAMAAMWGVLSSILEVMYSAEYIETRAAWALVELLDAVYAEHPTALSAQGIIGTVTEYRLNIAENARALMSLRYRSDGTDAFANVAPRAAEFAAIVLHNIDAMGRLRLDRPYVTDRPHYRYSLLARCMRARSAALDTVMHANDGIDAIEDVDIPARLLPDEGPAPYTHQFLQESTNRHVVRTGVPVNTRRLPRRAVPVIPTTDRWDGDDVEAWPVADIDRRIFEIVADPADHAAHDEFLVSTVGNIIGAMLARNVKRALDAMYALSEYNGLWITLLLRAVFASDPRAGLDPVTTRLVVAVCWTISKSHTIAEIVRAMTMRPVTHEALVVAGTHAIAKHPLFAHAVYTTVRAWAELQVDVPQNTLSVVLAGFAPSAWCLAAHSVAYAVRFPPAWADSPAFRTLCAMAWSVAAAGIRFRRAPDVRAAQALADETVRLFDYETMKVVMQQGRLEAVEWIMTTQIGLRMAQYFPTIAEYVMVTFPGADIRTLAVNMRNTLAR